MSSRGWKMRMSSKGFLRSRQDRMTFSVRYALMVYYNIWRPHTVRSSRYPDYLFDRNKVAFATGQHVTIRARSSQQHARDRNRTSQEKTVGRRVSDSCVVLIATPASTFVSTTPSSTSFVDNSRIAHRSYVATDPTSTHALRILSSFTGFSDPVDRWRVIVGPGQLIDLDRVDQKDRILEIGLKDERRDLSNLRSMIARETRGSLTGFATCSAQVPGQ